MINLLPQQEKRLIRAARTNTLLLRYCIATVLLIFLMAGLVGAMYMVLLHSQTVADEKIAETTKKTAQYASVQKEATEFQQNLAMAKTILEKDKQYSKLSINIAQIIPSGIVLQTLALGDDAGGNEMKFIALGKSDNDAIRLKSSFEQSPLFKNVYLDSVSKGVGREEESPYPVTIHINATLVAEGAHE